jgi:tRNA (cytidine/uridine-2'-O-)-methyltransferase
MPEKADLPAAACPLRLALFQPDIPQNTGTMLRMAACLGIGADIIEPAGFPVSDRHFRRSGMDYLDSVDLRRHLNFQAFDTWRHKQGARLIILTTRATCSHLDWRFQQGDILMVGRESAGLTEEVHQVADAALRIPMRAEMRSLNVAISAALAVGEALRQINSHPPMNT